MNLLRVLIAAVIAGSAAPTFAQEAPLSRIEAARAMIESADAADLFEAVEHEIATVRHRASGLTCRFYGNETRATIIVFAGLPRGDDVGCVNEQENQARTLYATRYPGDVTATAAMADAVAGIANRFADARPTPALLRMTSENLPEPLIQHFLITLRGEQWITSAFVARSGDWVIKLRYSTLAADEDAIRVAQLEASAIFALALTQIAEAAP